MDILTGREGETNGHCKALFWDAGTVFRCDSSTRRNEYHYCRDCWDSACALLEAPARWPPQLDDGGETRLCIGKTRVFRLTRGQFEQYAQFSSKAASFDERLIARDPDGTEQCYVYLLRLDDGRLYVGHSKDSSRRIQDHIDGKGAAVMKDASPIAVLAEWPTVGRANALRLEREIYQALRVAGNRVTMGGPGIDGDVPRAVTLVPTR